LHPEAMDAELSSSPYELIKVPYHYQDADFVKELLNKGSATFIGPGMGLKDDVRQLLKKVLPGLKKPCVIDADALTILAEKKIALPVQTILTPHKGEMNRLLKAKDEKNVTLDFIHECQRFAKKQKVTLILKGGPSFVFQEKGLISISAAGDPGMATAGSGDVLTGLVTALLAQGLSCESAALLGTFIHGTAGEFAAEEKTSYCMMASDIIKKFPAVFRILSSR
jgi:ADP-dependent NAD(P)H-hydrate dehydratase / NAD(P)H-hydrate epimerase